LYTLIRVGALILTKSRILGAGIVFELKLVVSPLGSGLLPPFLDALRLRFITKIMPQRIQTNIRNVRPAAQKKGKTQHKSRSNSHNSSQSLIPRQPRRSGLEQIQEIWTPLYPASIRRRLRYSTTFALSSSLGVPVGYLFAANGLFDPDVSGTGHQPMGFDQMMLSYNHYCVFSCRIIASFKNTATNSPTVAIRLDANNSVVVNVDQIIEYGALQMEQLQGRNAYGSIVTLTSFVDIRKIQGLKNLQDDSDLRGGLSSNPTELTYWHLMLWDSSGTSSTCNVDIVLEFDALFTEPRNLTTSLSTIDLHKFLLTTEKKTPALCDTGRFPKSR